MYKYLIVMVFFTISLSSQANDLSQSLVHTSLEKPLINEIIKVSPIADHHFNLEAPQNCGDNASITPTARTIECQFHSSGDKKVIVSVCDNLKKYCKQEYLSFKVIETKSKTPRMKQGQLADTKKMQESTKNLLMKDWITLTPEQAKKALNGKKGILAMVSTEWCPPCNAAKEFLLPTEQFKQATSDYLKIYVDGDSPMKDKWQSTLKSFYYPSFVVLNKEFEIVDLKVGYDYAIHFQEFMTTASQNLKDPITSVQARIDDRIAQKTSRKILDWFVPENQKETDEKRLISYYTNRNDNESALRYLRALGKDKNAYTIAATEFKDHWFGKQSKSLKPEEQNTKLTEYARTMIQLYPRTSIETEGVDSYLQFKLCMTPKTDKEDYSQTLKKIECEQVAQRLKEVDEHEKKNTYNQLLAFEQVYSDMNTATNLAKTASMTKDTETSESQKAICREKIAKLYAHTPLKQKSRSLRMSQLNCLSDKNKKASLAVVESIIKDYPYDATFYTALAKIHLKQKKYSKALEANQNALKYSYGDSWGANVVQQAKILKAMNKNKEALAVIEEALGEIVLNKNVSRNWWVNSLRAEHKDLTSKVK